MSTVTTPSHMDRAEAARLLGRQPTRFTREIIPTNLAYLAPREQVLLYSLVFALAPERCLEIGVMHGGGSRIIHAALSDAGRGRLIAMDLMPQVRIDWATIADRAELFIGRSPEDLPRAMELAGGPFDFVFLDGDHTVRGVRRDLEGLLGVTAPGTTILAHDAYYWEVEQAFEEAIRDGLPIRDTGLLSTTPNYSEPGVGGAAPTPDGRPVIWGGLRVLVRT